MFEDIKVGDIVQLNYNGDIFWAKITKRFGNNDWRVLIIDDFDEETGSDFYAEKDNFVRIWDISDLFLL